MQIGLLSRQWLESAQRLTIHNIGFIFVPYRVGVRGTKRVDSFAGLVTISEDHILDHADFADNLRDIGRVEDFGGNESTSVSRLHEMVVKIGIPRN